MGRTDDYESQKYYDQAISSSSKQEGKVIRNIRRGDIYYYTFTGKEVGYEIRGEEGIKDRRPCVVVSNNKANAFSGLVTVVPMTSKDKSPLSTRVQYEGDYVHGTFLCEQVLTISVDRLLNFCGEVDDETMKKIETALCFQLAMPALESTPPLVRTTENDFRVLEAERDFYKRSYFELIDRLAGRKA